MSSNGNPDLRIGKSPQDSAVDCSAFVLNVLRSALKSKGRASIALSGGKTPKLLFETMAKAEFDWSEVHVFWVDERCVRPDNPESNYKLANDSLLSPAHVPGANVHRIHGELPPAEGAREYLDEIREFFQLKNGAVPVFDVLHRGMGPDGHTASLFPGSPLVNDNTGIATDVWVEKMKMNRVTLLPAVLRAGASTVLQVEGADKADVLKSVLQSPEDLLQYPCQIASRDARAVWFLDEAAASKL